MSNHHFKFWPTHAMHNLAAPATNVFYNAEVSARRYPDKPFLVFYDTPLSFSAFFDEAQRIAGYLEHHCGVRKGDRVLLYMQNSPQFVIGYYGILRANAVVVPVNPMNLTHEISRCARDAGARTAIVSQELFSRIEPLLRDEDLDRLVVAAYSDYLKHPTILTVPEFVAAPRVEHSGPGISLWIDALASGHQPGPLTAGSDDLCVMPYTSGTTGVPKGCMHTHRSTMHTLVASMRWFALQPEMTLLAVAPLFHVTGMQGGMNGPLYNGNTVVLMPRWDRDVAAECVQRYRVCSWTGVPTMVQDFFSNPNIGRYDLSSIRRLSGGGAAMPAAVAQRLEDQGIIYFEGYGLSETMAATHVNPPGRPKKQCLGIPIYDVDSRVVDPLTLRELPTGEVGEIRIKGPNVTKGYWNRPKETAEAFVGDRFLTGDIGYMDADGYFYLVDRKKDMIISGGFNVYPQMIEQAMYEHPAVHEVIVIGIPDDYRGEAAKAFVKLRAGADPFTLEELKAFLAGKLGKHEIPAALEFVEDLPRTSVGKLSRHELRDRQPAAAKPQLAAGGGA